MKKLIPALLVFCFLGSVNAANNGLAFLKIPADARAAAMAGAFVASSDDASATQWNPAGLAAAESRSLVVMHNAWLWDFQHNMAGVQFATGKHNWAVSFNMLRVDGIEIRGEKPTTEAAGTTEAFTMAAALSYATTISGWQAGANIKYLFEQYYLDSAPGWALDLGLRKNNILSNTDFGASVFNMGSMSNLAQEATPLPLMARAGLAWTPDFAFLNKSLTLLPQITWVKDENTYGQLGLAYALNPILTLRGGWLQNAEIARWSGGLSITYKSLSIDYAYTAHDFELGSGNTFSLRFYF